MSRIIKSLVLAIVVLSGVAATESRSEAGSHGFRGFYSKPTFHKGFHSRTYHYFSYKHNGFRTHQAFYFNHKPKHVFFFNPHKKVWWGRYDLQTGGYSLLKVEDRKEKLEDIPEAAFGKPGALPEVEENGDTLEAPPAFSLPPVTTPKVSQPSPGPKNYRRN